jgi:uracil-DNA glycosylase family 4
LKVEKHYNGSMIQSSIDSISLRVLQQKVIACERCPRLIRYCRTVAQEKRRMYRDHEYWGKPLPSFGDPNAGLLILGLAPAAHGGNRTGRMFTGDRSGDFLYRALYEKGFANLPESSHRDDGLELRGCYITASLRCAPPQNKPLPEELRNCQSYLERELGLLPSVRAVLALGRIAFDAYLRLVYSDRLTKRVSSGARNPVPHALLPARSSFRFAHGASFPLPSGLPRLFASYHPSQQNTQTGKLTPQMMRAVLEDVQTFLRIDSLSHRAGAGRADTRN